MLRPLLEQLGVEHERTLHTLAVAISLGVITFLHTVIGELAPKAMALQLTEPIAMWAAVPVPRLLHHRLPADLDAQGRGARWSCKLLRLPPASEAEMLHSPEELRVVVQHVKLDPGARRLIDRVFDYTHRVARHVMTLRRDVVTLEAGRPFEDNLRIAVANQYTRYPLCEPVTDRVVGYVHLKDIVTALASGQHPQRMRELVREPIYASEDTRLEWLRREFQRRRVHIAIILGPGHSFTGIVTLEDLRRGGAGRDSGRAGSGRDPAHRAPRRRQLRGGRPADAGRRGARPGPLVPAAAARGRDAGRLHRDAAVRAGRAGRRHRRGGSQADGAGGPRSPHPPRPRRAPAARDRPKRDGRPSRPPSDGAI